jgi:hypothetical protein
VGTLRDLLREFAGQPRFFGVVLGVFTLVAVVDFASRALVLRGVDKWAFSAPDKVTFPVPPSLEAVDRLMLGWFPPPKVEEAAPAFREVQLEAVFKTRSAQRAAMIILGATPSQPVERRLVSAGEVIEGWTVSSIDLGVVVLKRDTGTRELKLFPAR